MTDELETVAEIVAPQIAIPVKATKMVLTGIAGLAVCGLVVFVVWKLFFAQHAAQAAHDVVQAKGNAAISGAGAAAGKDAIPIITNNYNYAARSDRQTQENQRAILQAPGASQQVDPALDALVRHDICMRPSASGLPECQHLLGPSP